MTGSQSKWMPKTLINCFLCVLNLRVLKTSSVFSVMVLNLKPPFVMKKKTE